MFRVGDILITTEPRGMLVVGDVCVVVEVGSYNFHISLIKDSSLQLERRLSEFVYFEKASTLFKELL
jgi:hypothetical protein